MPNPIEEPHGLREQPDALLRQTEEQQSRLGPVRAADSSVQATVKSPPGGQLMSLDIDANWIHRCTDESD